MTWFLQQMLQKELKQTFPCRLVWLFALRHEIFQKISITFTTSFCLSGTFLFLSLPTKWTVGHYYSKSLPVKEPRDLFPGSVLQLGFRRVSFSRLWELLGSYFCFIFIKKQSNRATEHLLSPYPVKSLCLLMWSRSCLLYTYETVPEDAQFVSTFYYVKA